MNSCDKFHPKPNQVPRLISALSLLYLCSFITIVPVALGSTNDFLQCFNGAKRTIVSKIADEVFEYSVLRLREPVLLLNTNTSAQVQSGCQPQIMVQSVAQNLRNLDVASIRIIKKLHASDDVFQTIPDEKVLKLLGDPPVERRQNWRITHAIVFGEISVVVAKFMNLNTNKEELDLWAFVKAEGRSLLVFSNPKFKAARGPEFVSHLFLDKLKID